MLASVCTCFASYFLQLWWIVNSNPLFLCVSSEVWRLHGKWRCGLPEQQPPLWRADRWIHLCPTRGSQPRWTCPVETDSKWSAHTCLGDYGAVGTDWPTIIPTNWKWGEFQILWARAQTHRNIMLQISIIVPEFLFPITFSPVVWW